MNRKIKIAITILLCNIAVIVSVEGIAQDYVADNMLLYQRSVGGWPKHIGEAKIDYAKKLSPAEAAGVADDIGRNDATIDNNATTKEIRYLVAAYKKTNNKNYLSSAQNGIRYLLKMQYDNGGFPQFYPDSSLYRSQVTYNDNAMINALNILWDVVYKKNDFEVVDAGLITPCAVAIKKGVDCILKTQVRVNGKLTVWCAQYDKQSLLPAKARAFELVSLSGSESVDIVEFLMKIENPSKEIKTAISSAVEWFERSKIVGYNFVDKPDPSQPKGRDRVLVPQAGSIIWARFYDIDTNRPFFSGRDSIKKWAVADIEYERRNGYAWYGTWPQKLLDTDYPKWIKKNAG